MHTRKPLAFPLLNRCRMRPFFLAWLALALLLLALGRFTVADNQVASASEVTSAGQEKGRETGKRAGPRGIKLTVRADTAQPATSHQQLATSN